MRSGTLAARDLGGTSAKTSKIMVRMSVANATAKSPNRRIAMIVVIDAAETLARLLPSKIVPSNCSGLAMSAAASLAP